MGEDRRHRGAAGRVVDRLRSALDALMDEGDGVVAAISGGADSVCLLHLLRFAVPRGRLRLHAAHFDHRMREDSGRDAHWVKGLCRAWDVPLTLDAAPTAPADEADARRARYASLEATRRAVGARFVATAHHAGDQAETVLFRAVRGAGIGGLRGIRRVRPPGVIRPLLDVTREELRAYAAAHRLTWREDPSNRDARPRNVLRGVVLPALERHVAPGAVRSLAALARHADEDERAWREALEHLLPTLGVEWEEGGVWLPVKAIRSLEAPLAGRVVRALASGMGVRLTRGGTRRAVEFTSHGRSGQAVRVAAGLEVARELDRVVLRAPEGAAGPDTVVVVPGPGAGGGRGRVGGRAFSAAWGPGKGGGDAATFDADLLAFPLEIRGRRPGDRIRLSGGRRRLKKVLLERGVPPAARWTLPVVADARGRVLWVRGVARSVDAPPRPGLAIFHIHIHDDPTD